MAVCVVIPSAGWVLGVCHENVPDTLAVPPDSTELASDWPLTMVDAVG